MKKEVEIFRKEKEAIVFNRNSHESYHISHKLADFLEYKLSEDCENYIEIPSEKRDEILQILKKKGVINQEKCKTKKSLCYPDAFIQKRRIGCIVIAVIGSITAFPTFVIALWYFLNWKGDWDRGWLFYLLLLLISPIFIALSSIIHEVCHGIFAVAVGGNIAEIGIKFELKRVRIYTKICGISDNINSWKLVGVHLAGIIGNSFLFTLDMAFAYWLFEKGCQDEGIVVAAVINIIFIIVDLLPIPESDGSQVWNIINR